MTQLELPNIVHYKNLTSSQALPSILDQNMKTQNNQLLVKRTKQLTKNNNMSPYLKFQYSKRFSSKTIKDQSIEVSRSSHKSYQLRKILPTSNVKDNNRIRRRISTAGNNSRFPKDFFKTDIPSCSSTKNASQSDFQVKHNLFENFMKKKHIKNRTKSMVEDKQICEAANSQCIENQMTPKFKQPLISTHAKYQQQNQFLFENPNQTDIEQTQKNHNYQLKIRSFQMDQNNQINIIKSENKILSNQKQYEIRHKAQTLAAMKKLKKNEHFGRKKKVIKKINDQIYAVDKQNNCLHLALQALQVAQTKF